MAGYEENWKKYKRLRNTFIAIFLGGFPLACHGRCFIPSLGECHSEAPLSGRAFFSAPVGVRNLPRPKPVFAILL